MSSGRETEHPVDHVKGYGRANCSTSSARPSCPERADQLVDHRGDDVVAPLLHDGRAERLLEDACGISCARAGP